MWADVSQKGAEIPRPLRFVARIRGMPSVLPVSGSVPTLRLRHANQAPVHPEGDYVLYWMIANRRLCWNYSLDRALEHCRALGKPLLILEALRCDYPWASDRLHQFVMQGMAEKAARMGRAQLPGVTYFPYVEPARRAGKGLLAALAARACVVVTDDFPCFFLPQMIAAAARQLKVRLEVVDSNGLLPLRAADQVFARAFDFRRFLQKTLPVHLSEAPQPDPLRARLPASEAVIPAEILRRWPAASDSVLACAPEELARLPIDHAVRGVPTRGGEAAAQARLSEFLGHRLGRYDEDRNQPELASTSELSPYLHFGMISAHEVFARLVEREHWTPARLAAKVNGSREGWWGMSPAAEAWVDQFVTWRELGYNFCWQRADYDQYSSLPEWVRRTLAEHARDERPHLYELEEFEQARTHDELWNAAQRQLVREGQMHNYLRMLWGKKILEWSRTPEQAAEVMIELNNKYALDGRNPNSYSGIFWCLGRYDRPWAPERPVFGMIRYMSSDNTARKLKVKDYLRQYAAETPLDLFTTKGIG